jgi:capsular polysaccharide transport system ATP-binding protein
MIVLNSVSKVMGRGDLKRTILDNVNWLIPPRARIVVLGQSHSGASVLLDIIAGTTLPTSGWVERRGTVSVPGGLLRYAMRDTTRQLILRLARLYRVDPKEVVEFIRQAFGSSDILDVPANTLPGRLRQQLNAVLTYAFPCDFYLLGSSGIGIGEAKFQAFCEQALALRCRQSGVIISTSVGKAQRLDRTMMGAVVYRGHLTLYERLPDAITVFECLPAESAGPSRDETEDRFELAQEDTLLL